MIITIINEQKANYDRHAYIKFVNNEVIYDDSDEEYGPINFSIDILEKALLEHKIKQNLIKKK